MDDETRTALQHLVEQYTAAAEAAFGDEPTGTIGCNCMERFGIPGCRIVPRTYSRQYDFDYGAYDRHRRDAVAGIQSEIRAHFDTFEAGPESER